MNGIILLNNGDKNSWFALRTDDIKMIFTEENETIVETYNGDEYYTSTPIFEIVEQFKQFK